MMSKDAFGGSILQHSSVQSDSFTAFTNSFWINLYNTEVYEVLGFHEKY